MKKVIITLGMFIFIVASAYAGTNDGLVAYYPFNGNANDESGNGNNGTVHGSTLTTDRFGNANSAYSFDGVDDYIQVTLPIGLSTGNSARTLSAWIYRKSDYDEQGILQYGTPSNGEMCGLIVSINNPDSLYFYGHNRDVSTNEDIPLNQWTYGAMTYDSATVKLYFNGLLSNSAALVLDTVLDDNGLTIGLRPQLNAYWTGLIDDIRIYNRALSDTEIQELYSVPCSIWADVISKYNLYVSGSATWADVIECYNQYAAPK